MPGLQGDDPTYLKLVATPKHYAVHSGPEPKRHEFNATVSLKDLRETYLPAFRDCVIEAKAESMMGAYNRTNGEVCCGSKTLLQTLLRDEWGFDGYVISDCWAIGDFHKHHGVTRNEVQSAACAVRNGCDLNCGCVYEKLLDAVEQGLLAETDIDQAVGRLIKARIRLGMFDPPEIVPYAQIPIEVNDCTEHRQAALEASRQAMVLLKNDGVLPLSKDIGNIAVIGPNADCRDVLLGNYSGTPSRYVTVLDGIRQTVSQQTRIWTAQGCDACSTKTEGCAPVARIEEALTVARQADAVVLVLGLTPAIEGEQGDAGNSQAGGDKLDLKLPGFQQQLMEAVTAVGKPVVLVLLSGSALGVGWAQDNVNAIVQAWYPGAEGGTALADVLFGDYSPAGRLPVTFYTSIEQLPDFEDYAMAGRTYRYLKEKSLYPFGYGLSYTKFAYSDLSITATSIRADETITVGATVTNAGDVDSDEVVQLYVRALEASVRVPNHELRGFKRMHLKAGQSEPIAFELAARDFSLIDDDGQRVLEPGRFEIFLGGSQPDPRSVELLGVAPLCGEIVVAGQRVIMPY